MDLKSYRMKIRSQLLDNINSQLEHNNAIKSGGSFRPLSRKHISQVEQELKNVFRPRQKKITKKVFMEDLNSDNESDESEPTMKAGKMHWTEGGKIHIAKSLKSLGNIGNKALKKIGNNVDNAISTTGKNIAKGAQKEVQQAAQGVAKDAFNTLKTGAKDFMKAAPEIESGLEASAPELEEAAPLLLAAGVKKPRKKRQVSEKEKRRHELIRKIMKKHGYTLAEASKAIKQHNIDY